GALRGTERVVLIIRRGRTTARRPANTPMNRQTICTVLQPIVIKALKKPELLRYFQYNYLVRAVTPEAGRWETQAGGSLLPWQKGRAWVSYLLLCLFGAAANTATPCAGNTSQLTVCIKSASLTLLTALSTNFCVK